MTYLFKDDDGVIHGYVRRDVYDAQSLELQAVCEALGKYGLHFVDCEEHRAFHRDHAKDCICGFDAALKPSRGA